MSDQKADTKVILPPLPPIKTITYRKRDKARVENIKNKEAIEAAKEEEKAGNISVVEPTTTMDFVMDIHKKAQEYVKENKDVIFKPNPGPQTEFLAASEKEVFYGGARGGGKSYSLLVDPLRYCSNSNHRALIIRRTIPELRDLIHHSQRIYKGAFPSVKWNEQEKTWRFPSGARIEFGYCEHPTDVLRYQGQAYSWIGIDELPQFPDKQVLNDLRGSLRTIDPNLPTFFRGTGNPGGAGNAWIREEFIDPAPANTPFDVIFTMPNGEKRKITRRYIPAKVYDNPYLLHNDDYVTMLASLPEVQRRQWLEGDWDAFEGAAFPEFRRSIHVIQPLDKIPLTWIKFRCADYGYSAPACCLWLAVDFDNNIYVYRELYGSGMNAKDFGMRVLLAEKDEQIRYGVIDSSLWAKRGDSGPPLIEQMKPSRWRPSDRSPGSRIAGKMQIHHRLAVNPLTNKPSLFIFDTCKNTIKQLSSLILDENNPEDVNTDLEDHAYDALRYGLMTRTMRPNVTMDLFGSRIQQIRNKIQQPADNVFGY